MFDKTQSLPSMESGLAVGLGRSYGDSSLNSQGLSWSCLSRNEVFIDVTTQEAHCGSGVTVGELERAAAENKLFPPVVPGTEFVTIGGAIASNVHGKSHHHYGAFGDHVTEILLLDSKGVTHKISPQSNFELFWATLGGMGLTGVILSAKIRLIPIENEYFVVEEQRVSSIDDLLSTLQKFDAKYIYTVAWIDLSGDFKGRGLVSGGRHARNSEVPSNMKSVKSKFSKKRQIKVPDIFPSFTINRFTVRVFNQLWFKKQLQTGILHYKKFLHPLDSIQDWNRIYGRKGFLQYQVQIPYGEEAFFKKIFTTMKEINAASFLGVVKRFGPSDSPFLSFPSEGWTIAIDIPLRDSQLLSGLRKLDESLSKIGGKVYLSKDARLAEEHFVQMYPQVEEWKEIKKRIDPDNYWQSDQGKRLNLC
jgi:decaprenylphospho-beta-D-ribofuranose 2-oxidase